MSVGAAFGRGGEAAARRRRGGGEARGVRLSVRGATPITARASSALARAGCVDIRRMALTRDDCRPSPRRCVADASAPGAAAVGGRRARGGILRAYSGCADESGATGTLRNQCGGQRLRPRGQ